MPDQMKLFTAILSVVFMLHSLAVAAVEQNVNIGVSDKLVRDFLAAAKSNDVGLLVRTLDQGVPVDSRDKRGRTALLIATYHDAVEVSKILIKRGADVNAKDALQDSPFLYAGAEGKLEILKLTVAAGADLDSINRYGGTALTPAAHHGHVDIVRFLLTTRINVDQVNFLGWTALLETVVLGDGGPIYQEIAKLLIGAGADLAVTDKEGKSALQLAGALGHIKIVEILKNAKNR